MIKFNQPRYILPLILLPFIYVFFYLFQYAMAGATVSEAEETEAINPALPDPFLEEGDLKDKFDAFQEAHKNNRDYSAMQEIDRREGNMHDSEPVPVTDQRRPPNPSYSSVRSRRAMPRNRIRPSTGDVPSDHQKQMQLFKAQMHYMDSLFRADEKEKGDGEIRQEAGPFENSSAAAHLQSPGGMDKGVQANRPESIEQKSAESLMVSKPHGINTKHFNTIMKDHSGLFIKAIIDEALKVTKGSRIRIRLLEDVMIGDRRVPEGHYLYGQVASLQAQRLEIHVSSMLLQDQIMPISLDIYDLDGLSGLYVPESQFRELTKTMGSSMASGQQLNIEAPTDNRMQLMYGLAKDAFNTTTRATSKALRKNKATVRYNTMVYLVNSSSKTRQTL